MAYLQRAADWPDSDRDCVKTERENPCSRAERQFWVFLALRETRYSVYLALPCRGPPGYYDQDGRGSEPGLAGRNVTLQSLLENTARPKGR